jgi:hypothetical protein
MYQKGVDHSNLMRDIGFFQICQLETPIKYMKCNKHQIIQSQTRCPMSPLLLVSVPTKLHLLNLMPTFKLFPTWLKPIPPNLFTSHS